MFLVSLYQLLRMSQGRYLSEYLDGITASGQGEGLAPAPSGPYWE